MSKNTLNKEQLKELSGKFDCVDWKTNVSDLIQDLFINGKSDDEGKFEIPNKYIELLKTKGSKQQKEYVESLGISLEVKRKTVDLKSAFEVLGLKYEPYIQYILLKKKLAFEYGFNEDEIMFEQSMFEIKTIFDAINKENNNWTPDYLNPNQCKYKPYFKSDGSAGVWSFAISRYYYTASGITSRLCVSTQDDAKYIGELILKLGYSI